MRFAIKDAGNVKVTNKATGIPIFYSEDANTFEYKFSAEAVFAKAKGENAIAFDGPTTAELKMEFEVIQFSQLAIMLASEVTHATNKETAKTYKGSIGTGKKVLIKGVKPVEGSVTAFKLQEDGQEFDGSKLEINGMQKTADYEITITSESVKEKDMVIIFYLEQIPKIDIIKMNSGNTTPNVRIDADIAARTQDGKNLVLHLAIMNAKAKKNAEFNLSAENPSKFTMEFDCFKDENGDFGEFSYVRDNVAGSASLIDALDINDIIVDED